MSEIKQTDENCTFETDTLISCLQIGKLLTSTFNLSEILELIMSKICRLIPAQNWSLLLKDNSTDELTFEVVVGIKKEIIENIRIKLGDGIAGRVAETGEPIFISDARDDPRINRTVDKLTGFTTESIICIPLQIHDKILGVLEIVNISDVERFKSKELPALQILVDYTAVAIENSRYFNKIQQISIIDEYTGLYNARYMHKILEELINKSLKQKNNLSVVFVDIDNFKCVVDTYGHLSGSQVLKEVGETVSACLSDQDILIKYGGDEYVVILPGRNKQAAIELSQNILHAIRISTYLKTETIPVKVTASFGVATFPDDAKTKKELLILADNLMYKVKKTCKNDIGMI